jgi:hypothetical protein
MDEWILDHHNITDVGDEDALEMLNVALKECVVDQVAENIWIESRIMLDTHEGDGFVLKPFARLFREVVVKYDALQIGSSNRFCPIANQFVVVVFKNRVPIDIVKTCNMASEYNARV